MPFRFDLTLSRLRAGMRYHVSLSEPVIRGTIVNESVNILATRCWGLDASSCSI